MARPAHDIATVAPARAWIFQLDHLGPLIPQHLGGIGTEHYAGEVKNADPRQGPGGLFCKFFGFRHVHSPHSDKSRYDHLDRTRKAAEESP